MRAAEVPVQVTAKVDAAVPVAEHNEMVWRGEQGAIVLRDWHGLPGFAEVLAVQETIETLLRAR